MMHGTGVFTRAAYDFRMHTPAAVTLLPVNGAPEHSKLLAGIAALELMPGQAAFVGEPWPMAQKALADPHRHLFAVTAGTAAACTIAAPATAETSGGAGRAVVGMGILHVNAGRDAGWADNDSAILLRGFMIDRRAQGLGYGTAATEAAVGLAQGIAGELDLPAEGVVLGVNEDNAAGLRAYAHAGFADHGRYLGGRSGPQRIMYRTFRAP